MEGKVSYNQLVLLFAHNFDDIFSENKNFQTLVCTFIFFRNGSKMLQKLPVFCHYFHCFVSNSKDNFITS